MSKGKITKRAVDALRQDGRTHFLWDDLLSGFGVKVTPAGRKVYVLQYRMGGRGSKTRRVTIGSHGQWTPDAARTEAKSLLQLVDRGIDPAIEKKQKRLAVEQLAFDTYAQSFLAGYASLKSDGTNKFYASMLKIHAVPVLKNRPLADISRADVTAVLDRIGAGKPATCRSVFATLSKLFNWAVARGDLELSPMQGMERPRPPKARDRVLTDKELKTCWRAAGAIDYPFGTLARLLILTGQRLREISAMNWAELDRDNAILSISGARTKNGDPSLVPLNLLALAEFDYIAGGSDWPKEGLVFTTNGRTPVSGFSKAKKRIDRAMADLGSADPQSHFEMAPWRFHDLRRTFATGMQRLGVRWEVTEAITNHLSGRSKSGVAAVYQRHDWAEEKRSALDGWGRWLEGLLDGGTKSNVLHMRVGSA
jgi:integrase